MELRALFAQATELLQAGKYPEVERLCEQILAACGRGLGSDPNNTEALLVGADTLVMVGDHAVSLEYYDRVLTIDPGLAMAHHNRANALGALSRFEDAVAGYDRALSLAPQHADSHFKRALALSALERWEEAAASCDRVLTIEPHHLGAPATRARAFEMLKRPEDVVASASAALAAQPDSVALYLLRGTALKDVKRYEEALADYETAIAMAPDTRFIYGEVLHLAMRICRWDGLNERIAHISRAFDAGFCPAQPFVLTATPASPQQLMVAAAAQFADKPQPDRTPWLRSPSPAGKLRLGYFSSGFEEHATAHLIAGLIEAHDRTRFEVIGFAFCGDPANPMRQRLARGFDELIDVSELSDREVATLARELGIDIAVDLNGYTGGARTDIFAIGAAPVQVSYLGYPGTMGTARFDYVVGDPVVTPPEHAAYFSEQIVRLPHSYQVNDRQRTISPLAFSRQELGLPENGFVFCCFNATFKITPDIFDVWMRLLDAVEGSVLWLLDDNPAATRNLRAEAEKRGVAPERLVFAPRMPAANHLARQRAADLFLDTLYYNAHTTASDALWAGLPVLTRIGETFAARVSASLLTAMGLPELITEDLEQYESMALALATVPNMLTNIKRRLEKNRLSTPLFDTARFTRNLETAYLQMWKTYEAGSPPAPIDVVEGAP